MDKVFATSELVSIEGRTEVQVLSAIGDPFLHLLGLHLGIVEGSVPQRESGAWWRSHQPIRIPFLDESLGLKSISSFGKVPWLAIWLERSQVERIEPLQVEISPGSLRFTA